MTEFEGSPPVRREIRPARNATLQMDVSEPFCDVIGAKNVTIALRILESSDGKATGITFRNIAESKVNIANPSVRNLNIVILNGNSSDFEIEVGKDNILIIRGGDNNFFLFRSSDEASQSVIRPYITPIHGVKRQGTSLNIGNRNIHIETPNERHERIHGG